HSVLKLPRALPRLAERDREAARARRVLSKPANSFRRAAYAVLTPASLKIFLTNCWCVIMRSNTPDAEDRPPALRRVEQLEDIYLFAAFDTLGDHRQRVEDDGRLGHSDRRVSTVFIFDDDPLHSEFLYQRITKNYSEALKFIGLFWLESPSLQDGAN